LRNAYAMLCHSVGLRASIFRYASTSTSKFREFHASFLRHWRTVYEVKLLTPKNMKQIKAHIAVSLDGFIATLDHELDWMPQSVKSLIGKEYDAADTLLMGANTYTYIFEHWGGWPHKGKRSFVVSSHDTNVTPDCGVEFLTDTPLRKVHEMKADTDMLVVGGGKLLTALIKAELLDSLTVYTVPVMLGKGVPFIGETFGSEWVLVESAVLDGGVIRSEYTFGKSL